MQFQIPQFIETEDKIVGPLTLKQFIYLASAFGISALLHFTVQQWLWLILSVPLVAAGAAAAFIKIGGRPLATVGIAAFRYYWQPQTYVWKPEQPHQQKNESAQEKKRPSISLEDIIAGISLRKTWQDLQTGAKNSPAFFGAAQKERYEIYRRLSGEPRAARRVDYR